MPPIPPLALGLADLYESGQLPLALNTEYQSLRYDHNKRMISNGDALIPIEWVRAAGVWIAIVGTVILYDDRV